MVWVIADIIATKPSVTVDQKVTQLLDPVNPVFDTSTLNLIKSAQKPNVRRDASPSATPTPVPTPIPSPLALPSFSASPSAEPISATGSALPFNLSF